MGPERATDEQAAGHLANVLVIVALAAMLLGAVVLLAGRDVYAVDAAPGESVLLLDEHVPGWDVAGRSFDATLSSRAAGNLSGNVTLYANDTQGLPSVVDDFVLGRSPDWSREARPGSHVTLTIVNHSNETVRTTGAVACQTCYWAGGILVGIGILGFVFYRFGMPRD